MDLLFVLNGALDSFDEAMASSAGRRTARKSYLGLLNLIDGFAVYGYLSNTLVKTVVVLDAEPNGFAVPSDTVTESFLRRLYFAYVETVSNPFFDVFDFDGGEFIGDVPEKQSKSRYPELQINFHESIIKLVEQANLV